GFERNRLHRGPQCRDRIPLGVQRSRWAAGFGGRSGPPSGDGHRYAGRHCGNPRCQSRDRDHSHRLHGLRGPGAGGSRDEPQPAGRQHNRRKLHDRRIAAKQVGLMHELIPQFERLAVLVNPKNPNAEPLTRDVQAAALTIGCQIEVFAASSNRDIDTVFPSLVQKRADGLLVSPDPLFTARRAQLLILATHHRLPAVYFDRVFTDIGGLMSYGANLAEQYRQVGIYVGRILKGEKPSDLPVIRPTKFEFVINLQTARTLGLTVPATLLALADEVIE